MNNKVSFLDKEDIVELLMQAFEAGTVSYLELARFSCEEIYDNFLNKKKQKELDYKLDFALKDLSPAQNTPDGYASGMLVGGISGDFISGTLTITNNNSNTNLIDSGNNIISVFDSLS